MAKKSDALFQAYEKVHCEYEKLVASLTLGTAEEIREKTARFQVLHKASGKALKKWSKQSRKELREEL